MVLAAGRYGVTCTATQGWKCRFRLSNIAAGDSTDVEKVAAGGKAKASGLGVGDQTSTRDNKSVAEIDKRYHLFGVGRSSGRSVTESSGLQEPITLTRRVQARRESGARPTGGKAI
jgi:hypothetical protein